MVDVVPRHSDVFQTSPHASTSQLLRRTDSSSRHRQKEMSFFPVCVRPLLPSRRGCILFLNACVTRALRAIRELKKLSYAILWTG